PPEKQSEMNGFRANRIRAPLAYRARNMDGIWATAPYLHNNSVPNLYQLLLPVARRDTRFFVGNLEFDPGVVGFKTAKFTGGFEFRTSVAGNSNAGHEFRDGPRGKGVIGPLLTEAERWAIIEFLKTK
ncbi:MAG TPA: di-heme-cytochrome C peroxidase, partial [Pyrinomonadaceae bacterium]|nr:di-heme-cytochrome C peroxidase [Pyrinomonadaceae bacterium]